MLKIPLADNPVDHISIVGIDPGSDTMGIGCLKIDIKTLEIIESTAWTIVASKMVKDTSWDSVIYSYKYARIEQLKKCLISTFNRINPIIIVCESPFYNPRRPNAYGVLVEVLKTVKDSVNEHDRWKPLYLIDPSSIKKSVGASGGADKTAMKEKVSKLSELKFIGDTTIEELDEHAIDALATAYCKYKLILKGE
jgi:Holliday junction resolvasome RuvABC endonuclease subunit